MRKKKEPPKRRVPIKINEPKKKKTLIFDMDGVLIDVSESYIKTIKKTAEFFLGRIIDIEKVHELKSSEGFNNDYDCAEALTKRNGFNVRRDALEKKFQEYYKGRNYDGLIRNEKLIIEKDLLKELSKKYNLAIFTGRPHDEAMFTLEINRIDDYFCLVVTMENVKNQKPNPEGLKKIKDRVSKSCMYFGDCLDDAQAAVSAEMDFVAVMNSFVDKKKQKALFKQYDIDTIIDDINKVKKVL